MPAQDSVREIIPKVAPTGMKYRILRTTERDTYEQGAPPKTGKGKTKRAS